jgi:hypothetical protein
MEDGSVVTSNFAATNPVTSSLGRGALFPASAVDTQANASIPHKTFIVFLLRHLNISARVLFAAQIASNFFASQRDVHAFISTEAAHDLFQCVCGSLIAWLCMKEIRAPRIKSLLRRLSIYGTKRREEWQRIISR